MSDEQDFTDYVEVALDPVGAAAEITRLRAELAEAREVKHMLWRDDVRRLGFDSTMLFSNAYDWDGYELFRKEAYADGYGYIIWPDRISGGKWNVYCTLNGLFIPDLECEQAAKDAAQADYASRILAALVKGEA